MGSVTPLHEARLRRDGPGSMPSDEALIAGVLAQDGRVARLLYARLKPTVERALRRLAGGNKADLDDLIQVAFERIIISLRQGRFENGRSLDAWATVIASRSGMDHLRSVYRKRKYFVFVDEEPLGSVAPRGDESLEILEVRRALAHLKPSHAEVLFLHDALGYELKEIAEHLDISVAAAQSRLVRTRKDLIQRLKKQEGNRR